MALAGLFWIVLHDKNVAYGRIYCENIDCNVYHFIKVVSTRLEPN